MKPKIDYLGKVSCTVSKDYWSSEKDYDKLTIVEKEGEFGTFISRKPVLAGTPLTNREFWIPFSSVKESIILDYNSFKDKYDKTLEEYKISLDNVISRLKVLEESDNNIAELIEIANGALNKANSALAAVTNINNKLAKPNGIATLDSTGKVPLTQLPNNIGGGSNLELGETSTTAYPGDKGKRNANAINSLTTALDSLDNYSKTTRNQLDAFKNTKGQALGIVPLDENGKVTSSYLPSYVDDVLEYDNRTAFPTTGESSKIYIALDTNKTYRWGGTTYVELSSSVTLGETSSTAYAGDKGKKNREDINNLKNSFDSLANNLDEVNNKANTNTTAIEELTTEVDSTNTEVNTINGKISKLNTTIGDVSSAFSNYTAEKTPIIDKVEPHIADTQNPHSVTKTQVGLGNVTNDPQVKRSEMGANNGVATLNEDGKIPESQLPAGVTSSLILGETEGTAYEGSKGSHNKFLLDRLINNGLSIVDSEGITNTNTGIKIPNDSLTYNDSSTDINVINSPINIPVSDSTKTRGCGLLLNTDKKKLDGLFNIAGGLQDIDVANPTSNGITLGLDYYTFDKTTGETGTNTRNISILALTDSNTTLSNCGLLTGIDRFRYETAVTYIVNLPDNIVGGGHATAADNGIILSLDGTNKENGTVSSKDILIPNADGTKTNGSGLMLNSDKTKIDNLPSIIAKELALKSSTNTNITLGLYCKNITFGNSQTWDVTLSAATNLKAGLLSAKDKVKLDSLSNYTLPTANSTTLGGIKIGSGLNIDSNGIVSVDNKLYILVDSLELVTTPDSNKIYLVLNSSSTSETNSFTEYVWVTSDTGNKWEKIGEASATVDLADYYNKTEINNKLSSINESITYINSINSQQQTAINNKVDKVEGKGLSTNDFTNEYKNTIDSLDANGSYVSEVSIDDTYTLGIKLNVKSVTTDTSDLINESIVLPVATTTKNGLLSKEDKVKLDNLASSSNITEYTTNEITALLKQIRF